MLEITSQKVYNSSIEYVQGEKKSSCLAGKMLSRVWAMKRRMTTARALGSAVLVLLLPVLLQPGCASSKSGKAGKKEAVEQEHAADREGTGLPGPSIEADGTDGEASTADSAGKVSVVENGREAGVDRDPVVTGTRGTTPRDSRTEAKVARDTAFADETEIQGIARTTREGPEQFQLVTRRATPWEVFYYRIIRATSARSWKQLFSRGWMSTRALFRKLIPFLNSAPDSTPLPSGAA